MYKIYGGDACPFCHQAKHILQKNDLPHEWIDVMTNPEMVKELKSQGLRTIPQIWLDDTHIGGYNDLVTHLQGDN